MLFPALDKGESQASIKASASTCTIGHIWLVAHGKRRILEEDVSE